MVTTIVMTEIHSMWSTDSSSNSTSSSLQQRTIASSNPFHPLDPSQPPVMGAGTRGTAATAGTTNEATKMTGGNGTNPTEAYDREREIALLKAQIAQLQTGQGIPAKQPTDPARWDILALVPP